MFIVLILVFLMNHWFVFEKGVSSVISKIKVIDQKISKLIQNIFHSWAKIIIVLKIGLNWFLWGVV